MNNLHSLVISAPDELRERLRGLSTTKLVATCAGFRPGDCDSLQVGNQDCAALPRQPDPKP